MCWVNPTPPILQRDNPHLLLGQSCHLTVLCNKQSTVPLSPDDILKQPIAYYLSVLYIGDNQHQRRPGWRTGEWYKIFFSDLSPACRALVFTPGTGRCHHCYKYKIRTLHKYKYKIHIMHPITAQKHTWLNFAIRRLMTKPQDYKL